MTAAATAGTTATEVEQVIGHYFAAWNETDPATRRALIARTWTEDGSYLDPLMSGEGHDGIIRARYRQGTDAPRPITPGQVYEYEINLWATSNLFRKGHRIGLEVSSSNFPRFDRNLNTGHELGVDSEMLPAMQTIFHDREHPSRLVLPIVPR